MIRRFITALASVLCVQATPHPSLPGQVVPYGLGVNIHFTDPVEGEMELLAAAGFRWVRMDFSWSGTERERGVYDFSAYDRLAAHLTKHGMKALFILDYGNKLYESDSSVRTAEGRAAFARWAAAAVKHFQGRGYLWEIWNEPNISFWKPAPNVDDYAALANAAAKAIHEAVPNEAVIGPATSGIDLAFISGCLERGTLDGWAAVSVHPYRQSAPESAATEYRDLRQLIRKHSANRDVPVVSGEWGYSAAWKGYNEELQGVMLARQFLTNLSNGIPLSIWYDWKDDGADPKEPEHHFGTVGHPEMKDGKPIFRLKHSYLAARALTNSLRDCSFSKRLAIGSAEDHVLLFENGRELVVACWTEAAEPREVRFPREIPTCPTFDHLGNEVPPPIAGKSLRLGGTPIYLKLGGNAAFLTFLSSAPAFSLELIRLPGGKFVAWYENPDGQAFSADASLEYENMLLAQPLRITAGERTGWFSFPTTARDATPARAGLTISLGDTRIPMVPKRMYSITDPSLFERCNARNDGDPKIGGTQSFALTESETPPFPGMAVWELKCGFEPGWRFVTLTPGEVIPISNKPKVFSFWVHGDASGVQLRLRVKDANGRIWQPDGEAVNWKGWKHVRVSLKPTDARWGGQSEEVLRYPLQWDAVFLVDNTSRKALQSRLLFTPPVMEE